MQGGGRGVGVYEVPWVSLPAPQYSVPLHLQSLPTSSAMLDIQEPSGSERAYLQIIPDPDSNPAAAIQALVLPLIPTLNQSDRDGVTSLVKSIVTTISRRRRALNDTNSPLLRLPTELLVEIGYQVMRMKPARSPPVMPGRRMRSNWRTAIGDYMNTSSRLRQEVNLVPPTGVTLRY